MVGMFMMQPVAIHPGDRIDIDRENIVHDGDGFHEPFLIVQGAMSDSQMKKIGQIQPAKKPAKDKIGSADQYSFPWSPLSRSGIHASQQVQKNDQIAYDVVYFHDPLRGLIQAEIRVPFKIKSLPECR